MATYASGAKAKGICDVCGLTMKLATLKALTVNGKVTNTLACRACWTPDHPQLHVGKRPIHDPQALRNPRPDTGALDSRNVAWGYPTMYLLPATTVLGKVTTL